MKKISDFARLKGVHYRTAWRWFHDGMIKGTQLPNGTILIDDSEFDNPKTIQTDANLVAVYARVSSSENKANLDSQAERIASYCAAKGWKINSIVKEVGSGLNDSRPKLLRLLADPQISIIVVEHKDRLTRFGFNYIETLLANQGRKIEVINETAGSREDLIEDFISSIKSFFSNIYGKQEAKKKIDKLIAEITDGDNDES